MIGNTSYGPTSRTTTTDVGPLASMPNYQGLMDWARKLAIWRRGQTGSPASSSPRGELGGAVASSHVDTPGPATVPPNSSPALTALFASPFHGGVGMTGGMSPYVPGQPISPGNGPVATGYLPAGYEAPKGPGNSSVTGGGYGVGSDPGEGDKDENGLVSVPLPGGGSRLMPKNIAALFAAK